VAISGTLSTGVTELGGHGATPHGAAGALAAVPAGCVNRLHLPGGRAASSRCGWESLGALRAARSVGTGRESWREAFFHLPTPSSPCVCQAWLPFESFSLCQAREKGRGGIKRKREEKKKTHRNVSRDLASFRLPSPEYPGSRGRDGGRGKASRDAALARRHRSDWPRAAGGGHGRGPRAGRVPRGARALGSGAKPGPRFIPARGRGAQTDALASGLSLGTKATGLLAGRARGGGRVAFLRRLGRMVF